GPDLPAGGDDLVDGEIRFARRRRTQAHSLIGEHDVPRILVRVRVHGYRLDAHAAGCLDDPAGDFAAIGDQYFWEHGAPRLHLPRFTLAVDTLHRGMFPCLRHGFSSSLSRSIARLRQMRLRVSCGMMTSSMKPRWPAMNGLANFSLYSFSRAAIFAGSP